MIGRVQRLLDGDTRILAMQVLRYGVAGLGITLFQSAVYLLLSGPARMAPLVANTLAFVLAFAVGYVVHSRFSFAGHGTRGNVARTGGRFVTVSLVGFAINSFWVWSMTTVLRWPDWTPTLPWLFVTPFVMFVLNRRWVFE